MDSLQTPSTHANPRRVIQVHNANQEDNTTDEIYPHTIIGVFRPKDLSISDSDHVKTIFAFIENPSVSWTTDLSIEALSYPQGFEDLDIRVLESSQPANDPVAEQEDWPSEKLDAMKTIIAHNTSFEDIKASIVALPVVKGGTNRSAVHVVIGTVFSTQNFEFTGPLLWKWIKPDSSYGNLRGTWDPELGWTVYHGYLMSGRNFKVLVRSVTADQYQQAADGVFIHF